MNTIDLVAMALLIVGGINWGLVGAFDFNLVTAVLGEGTILSRIVFILVGVAALYMLASLVSHTSDSMANDPV